MIFNRLPKALTGLSLLVATATSGCATGVADDAPTAVASETAELTTNWWQNERERRLEALEAHLQANDADFKSYMYTPSGNVGIPVVLFRLFPEVFPDVFMPPEAKLAHVGMGPDLLDPSRVMPRGLGFAPARDAIQTPAGAVNLNVVAYTCAACHSGSYTDEAGQEHLLVGAPSPTFDFNGYRGLISIMLQKGLADGRFTAQTFVDALNAKPMGWLYNDPSMLQQEAIERQIFNMGAQAILDGIVASAQAGTARIMGTIGKTAYETPEAGQMLYMRHPGHMDAMTGFNSLVADPAKLTEEQLHAILPKEPSFSDYMYVWKQGERSASKWGNDVPSAVHANSFAALGMVGDPHGTLIENTIANTRFTMELPSAPYPFEVERDAAARGGEIFEALCADCHAPGNANTMSPEETGTDPWRARVFTPPIAAGLRIAARIACSDPVACFLPDGSALPDDQVLRITGGYAAIPLDGIWARAPYLHNGSVPTLRALLTGDRPETFFRGNTTYDQENVGYTWDAATRLTAAEFDTRLPGSANTGHIGEAFYGDVDFATDARALEDLLEYMKTL